MRAGRYVVTLAGECAGQLANPTQVEYLLIDLDVFCVELRCESLQDSLDTSAIICRQIDPEEEMKAVAGVGQDRLGPAAGCQVFPHGDYSFVGIRFLGITRTDVSVALGVCIHQQPTSGEDVGVLGEFTFSGPGDPVAPASEEIGFQRVQREINAACERCYLKCSFGQFREMIGVEEPCLGVWADFPALNPQCAEFHYLVWSNEKSIPVDKNGCRLIDGFGTLQWDGNTPG
jgi:hypothetical protein